MGDKKQGKRKKEDWDWIALHCSNKTLSCALMKMGKVACVRVCLCLR
jgi:hypothetical protein